jgi:hypothetical protein
VLSLIILAACSKGGGNDGAAIPADLPFNEKALPPISDEDLAQAKTVAKASGEAAAPQSIVLVKKDESDHDRQERETKISKLRPELQRIVRGWQQECVSNPQKSGNGIDGVPRAGQTYKTTETNAVSGARCTADLNERIDSTITVTQFSQQPLNFGMSITASGTMRAAFRDPAEQRVLGARGFDMNFTMSGRFERNGDQGSSFMRLQGSGNMDSLDLGAIRIEATSDNLERPGAEKSLNTYRISQGGKTFVFTQYTNETNKINPVPRFFIGNRELTRDEVAAMGDFPFEVNENKTILRVR